MISPQRRAEVIDALRRGTVPKAGLDALAVGYGRLQGTLDEELAAVASGRGTFKAIRGEYGSGKTFFGRWLQERARARGLATSEVQISETETPLHRLETVYRRLIERIATADSGEGAFRGIVDGWFYALERDVLEDASLDPTDEATLLARTEALMEARLASVTRVAPAFSATLRAYRRALQTQRHGRRAARLARRPAQCRGIDPALGRGERGHRSLRRDQLPLRAADDAARLGVWRSAVGVG